MDLYRSAKPDKPEQHYVTVGRIAAFSAMAIALVLARPFLGGFESAFQTVQEYTGYIAPGVVIVFLLGFFDKRANTAGAYTALIGSVVMNIVVNAMLPDMPFVIRIWIVFLVGLVAAIVVSRLTSAPEEEHTVNLGDISFTTATIFNTLAALTIAILIVLYALLW
jgi:SSS family solute:Na+ symporter